MGFRQHLRASRPLTIGIVLDSAASVPVSFPMAVKTIGEALDLGWRVTVRCSFGPRDGMKRGRECVYGGELDLPTLVWTRGRQFPIGTIHRPIYHPVECARCRLVECIEKKKICINSITVEEMFRAALQVIGREETVVR